MVTLFYINTHSCLLTILPRVPDLTCGKKVTWSLSFYDSLRPGVFSQELMLHGCIEGYGLCHLLLRKCTKYYVQITQNIIYIYIYIYIYNIYIYILNIYIYSNLIYIILHAEVQLHRRR